MLLIQKQIAAQLKSVSDESDTEARLILAHVLNCQPTELINYTDEQITSTLQVKINQIIQSRLTGKPLQYILQEVWFYRRRFYIDERALIPRPESEWMIEAGLEFIKAIENKKVPKQNQTHINSNSPKKESELQQLNIADVGSGSGNLAITLAKELADNSKLQNIKVYAVDVSPEALEVASININNNFPTCPQPDKEIFKSNPTTTFSEPININNQLKIEILQGNLLEPLLSRQISPDIIIANLPYIPTGRISRLQTEVKDHEPHVALDGGEDGFELYREFFQQITQLKNLPRLIITEIDYTHIPIAQNIITQYLSLEKFRTSIEVHNYTGFIKIESIN